MKAIAGITSILLLAIMFVTNSSSVTAATNYNVTPISSCTLPDAIIAANTNAVQGSCSAGSVGLDTITMAAGTYALTANLPIITEDLHIIGASVDTTLIDGDDTYSGLIVKDSNGSINIELDKLTIQNTFGDSVGDESAGLSVIAEDSIINLDNVRITGNRFDDSLSTFGFAGIFYNVTQNIDVTITNSEISNNQAIVAGISNNVENDNPAANLVMTNVNINNNFSIDGNGASGCLLGLGDSGWLWSFNTDDGSLPCQRTISVATLNPQAYYCSGSGSVSGWNQVETSNTNFADFDEILVTIKDTNGDVIPGYDGVDILPSSGILDISGIPYSGDTQDISVEVILIALNGDPWTGSNNPIITTTFFGDDAQICFQTVPQDNCDIPSIINGASSTTTQIDDGSVDTQVSNVSMGLILGNGTVCGAQTSQPNNGDTTTLASNNNPLADTGSPYSLFYMVGAGFILLAIIGILRRIQQ